MPLTSKTFVPAQKPNLLNGNHILVWHKIYNNFWTGTVEGQSIGLQISKRFRHFFSFAYFFLFCFTSQFCIVSWSQVNARGQTGSQETRVCHFRRALNKAMRNSQRQEAYFDQRYRKQCIFVWRAQSQKSWGPWTSWVWTRSQKEITGEQQSPSKKVLF